MRRLYHWVRPIMQGTRYFTVRDWDTGTRHRYSLRIRLGLLVYLGHYAQKSTYYSCIMLNAFWYPLFPKLCRHNPPNPIWQHVLHRRVRAHCTVCANQVAEFSYVMLIKNVRLWRLLTVLVLLILTRLLMLPVGEWGTKGCFRSRKRH